jgi:hypothetical protein
MMEAMSNGNYKLIKRNVKAAESFGSLPDWSIGVIECWSIEKDIHLFKPLLHHSGLSCHSHASAVTTANIPTLRKQNETKSRRFGSIRVDLGSAGEPRLIIAQFREGNQTTPGFLAGKKHTPDPSGAGPGACKTSSRLMVGGRRNPNRCFSAVDRAGDHIKAL